MPDKMERRDFLKTVGLGAAALALPGCAALSGLLGGREAPKRPNIVVALCDDLGGKEQHGRV